ADDLSPPEADCLGPQFVVHRVLGRGGMGIVYAARDLELGRDVAVKLTLDAQSSERLQARLEREGQALAQLKHPGIVQVHRAGTLEGRSFLVCELIEGARGLQVASGDLALRERVGLIRDAARAIGAAHAQGIVHRDLKPDNLLVDAAGKVHVADFGVALIADAARLTQTGGLVGTPYYMAPEQISGERDAIGPHSDVWSLGVVLYQTLTGQLPFVSESFGQLGFAIMQATPESPRRLNPEVSSELARVCATAIARDPAQRYPDGEAFARALDACLEARPTRPALSRALVGLLAAAAIVAAALAAAYVARAGEAEPPPTRRDDAPQSAAAPADSDPGSADLEAELGRALDAWRRLSTPLERYVEGVALLRRWPAGAGLERVRAQVAEAQTAEHPLATLPVTEGGVNVTFGPGSTLYATAGEVLVAWDARTGLERERSIPAPGVARGALFALGNGDLICAGKALDWLRPGASPVHVPGRRDLNGPQVDAGERLLLAATSTGPLELYAIDTRELLGVLPGDHDPALACALSPDGTKAVAFIANEGEDLGINELLLGELIVWALPSREILLREELLHRIRYASFTPDGARVFAGDTAGSLRAYDATTGEPGVELFGPAANTELLRRRAHAGSVRGLRFLGPTRLLSVAGVSQGNPYGHQLRLWNADTGKLLWELRPLPRYPNSLSASPELGLIALGTSGVVELYALPDVE
ncbi:MAG: protein kinase, partial [Planctomycetes bacterium]|nr:protein kinase [Planctomycetota bacterium]